MSRNRLETQLYHAIEAGDACLVRYQLQNGADPNTVFTGTDTSMRLQWSALHICCQKGQFYCAKQLVEAGRGSFYIFA